jgi:hypothetical protein
MERRQLLMAMLLWLGLAIASPTPDDVRREIDALLARLQDSGCQFNRNGSWYNGSQARDHLLRKLEYLERSMTIESTEQFIELAATRSSRSGKAYEVRCGIEAPVASSTWLTRQLAVIRGAAGKGGG